MHLLPQRSAKSIFLACLTLLLCMTACPPECLAQVRTKKPDRGVYQPPLVAPLASPRNTTKRDEAELRVASQPPRLVELMRDQKPSAAAHDARRESDESGSMVNPKRPLVEVELTEVTEDPMARADVSPSIVPVSSKLKRVTHQEITLQSPVRVAVAESDAVDASQSDDHATLPPDDVTTWSEPVDVIFDGGCDGCLSPDCDSIGCDSMGGCDSSWLRRWSNARCRLNSDCWFGGVELMLMFRKGSGLPPLVTTSDNPDPDLAGQLDDPNTQIVVGNESILKDMTAGGRFTLGTWIDNRQCRSLVLRGWFAGEETYGFHANQDTLPIITRPFLNVSDNQTPAQDTLLVAFPGRADGSISVGASSDVYGADLQVRQFCYCKYGATVDLLYGYQYMRLSEDLSISSTSTSLIDTPALGAVISVADAFDTENEFHGGQFGIATRYREGCWSFNGLLKTGFGSLRRRAKLSGSTFTSVDGANAVVPEGLLVRDTNSGTFTDNTFGWVPELDLSLGWQQYPQFDVTVGYHLIAMTEALQVPGAIDPNLAVNLSASPMGAQRPAAALRYNTYYMQGIHFGLQYVY
jgi:hypothetical protein